MWSAPSSPKGGKDTQTTETFQTLFYAGDMKIHKYSFKLFINNSSLEGTIYKTFIVIIYFIIS